MSCKLRSSRFRSTQMSDFLDSTYSVNRARVRLSRRILRKFVRHTSYNIILYMWCASYTYKAIVLFVIMFVQSIAQQRVEKSMINHYNIKLYILRRYACIYGVIEISHPKNGGNNL